MRNPTIILIVSNFLSASRGWYWLPANWKTSNEAGCLTEMQVELQREKPIRFKVERRLELIFFEPRLEHRKYRNVIEPRVLGCVILEPFTETTVKEH